MTPAPRQSAEYVSAGEPNSPAYHSFTVKAGEDLIDDDGRTWSFMDEDWMGSEILFELFRSADTDREPILVLEENSREGRVRGFVHRVPDHVRTDVLLFLPASTLADLAGASSLPVPLFYRLVRTTTGQPDRVPLVGWLIIIPKDIFS